MICQRHETEMSKMKDTGIDYCKKCDVLNMLIDQDHKPEFIECGSQDTPMENLNETVDDMYVFDSEEDICG